MGEENKVARLGFAPPHPGEYLRDTIMPAIGMSVADLAAHLGVARPTLSRLVNGRSSVSMDMARRLGKAFGMGPRIWLALQMQYDLWHAENEPAADVEPINWKDAA